MMTVKLERHGDVAVVTLDNPPVNALGRATRLALLDAVEKLDADHGVRAVVLTGAGKLFVGGADIAEFDAPPQEPHLPDVLARVEAARAPWIAALHGAALGGGLELALACRLRIAAPGTTFAMPEVNLGLIPGAGGTQRLPRLVGPVLALAMIAENRTLDTDAALGSGLVDRIADPIADGALVAAAIGFARESLLGPIGPAARDCDLDDPGEPFWQAARTRIAKAARGQTAPLCALDALRHGAMHGIDAGLEFERATFLRLRASDEAAALRYLFFAERAALRPADLRGVAPKSLMRVGVVGGGTMGVGIVAALRNAGVAVVLSERDQAGLDRGMTALQALFDAAAKRGSLTPQAAAARVAGVTGTVGFDGLSDCDLVIEAVFEDLGVKREVFAALARICPAETILATNTSYIDPRLIFDGLTGPDRCVGLHFFSPAQVMKLLEIVPLPATSPRTLATAFALGAQLGKVPVRSGICDGFIGNRILRRYRHEAEAMLRQGVTHAAIDAAMRGFGYAMGPFEMQDLAGLDISFLHREAARARGEDVPETPGDILVRAGRKGQKTGAGWYDYHPGDRSPHHSDRVAQLLAPLLGPPPDMPAPDMPAPDMPAAEIANRLVAAMASEGQRILDEGIAGSRTDIDLVEVHGYGFPRTKGGPMFIAARAAR